VVTTSQALDASSENWNVEMFAQDLLRKDQFQFHRVATMRQPASYPFAFPLVAITEIGWLGIALVLSEALH
jgi:hypothetical protein